MPGPGPSIPVPEERSEEEKLHELRGLLVEHTGNKSHLVPALHLAQDVFGYLPRSAQGLISEVLDIPKSRIFEVASFYSFFYLEPRGRHVIRVCMGTACYVRGAGRILRAFEDLLGIRTGGTTDDKLFSLDACRCLGCCSLAPVAMIGGDIHGSLTPQMLPDIVERYRHPAADEGARERPAARGPKHKPFAESIVVCSGTGCVSAGCAQVRKAVESELDRQGIRKHVNVIISGCVGPCDLGPILIVNPGETFYQRVAPADVPLIVRRHVLHGKPVRHLLYDRRCPAVADIPFFARQEKRVLCNCGRIDALDIDAYRERDGFKGLEKAIGMPPEEIVRIVKDSGLRGRGGAGYPTGEKWQAVMQAQSERKFVICNADEGDPGAFMDRSLLEGDPYSIIEGMAVAGRAVGAEKGFVHVRAEYPLAVERLEAAIERCRDAGTIGAHVLGADFRFDIEVRVSAGAFVCGEETALIRSIEGFRPSPTIRPPYPSTHGLWGTPTLVNNVETFANIPAILRNGSAWFRSVGTPNSPGTKIFALAGDVRITGLIEVPTGATLREIIYEIGGGVTFGRGLKAVQIGGPSGGCIPAHRMDTPVDFDSLAELGAIMGSGGMVVLAEGICMVNLARFFLEFVQDESCGKCVPCRLGTKKLLSILRRITGGQGERRDIEELERIGRIIQRTALCGLGRTAPNPVLSTLKYFRDEYEFHVAEKRCPFGICEPNDLYRIDEERCVGCGKCVDYCPEDAIHFQPEHLYAIRPYVVDEKACTACGECVDACPFGAILKQDRFLVGVS